MKPLKVLVADDGSMAAEVELVVMKTGAVYTFLDREPVISTRYLVASSSVASNTFSSSIRKAQTRGETGCRAAPQAVRPDQDGWHMLPYSTGPENATASMLPSVFNGSVRIYKAQGMAPRVPLDVDGEPYMVPQVPFVLDGNTYDVSFFPEPSAEHCWQRPWWSYPLQICIAPAIVVDVITAPLQAIALCSYGEFGR